VRRSQPVRLSRMTQHLMTQHLMTQHLMTQHRSLRVFLP
jgi:hypothetical protein